MFPDVLRFRSSFLLLFSAPLFSAAAAAFDELKIVIKLRLLSLHLKIIIINTA